MFKFLSPFFSEFLDSLYLHRPVSLPLLVKCWTLMRVGCVINTTLAAAPSATWILKVPSPGQNPSHFTSGAPFHFDGALGFTSAAMFCAGWWRLLYKAFALSTRRAAVQGVAGLCLCITHWPGRVTFTSAIYPSRNSARNRFDLSIYLRRVEAVKHKRVKVVIIFFFNIHQENTSWLGLDCDLFQHPADTVFKLTPQNIPWRRVLDATWKV